MSKTSFLAATLAACLLGPGADIRGAAEPAVAGTAQLLPLSSVRLLASPFGPAVKANRAYMLALDPDRLLAPFRREAGLEPRKPSYANWENIGLDGHTAGHYLSALANMIAAGEDTPDGEFRRRLDHMVDELELCQNAARDGYLGGVPGSQPLWSAVATGKIDALNGKWVPWYNLHKTFAGLRDAHLVAGHAKARELLVRYGDWCDRVTSGLSEKQMQRMLGTEFGGMNEVMADLAAMTGDQKYLAVARRFHHQAVLDPLIRHEDRLTRLHANTQIPKVIGLERIATLTGDAKADAGARFFWENVTRRRTVAFGGNSVGEHFNDPADFRGMLEHREGPETCNTYNMLRLTEQLFASGPQASHADFYERALFNHLLSAINPATPGYVYFTPIRPAHYRVYSQPSEGFWCCVGTGMENPGKYGQFIYARSGSDVWVNLFVGSEAKLTQTLTIRQETAFPDEEGSRLTLSLAKPERLTLRIRHPSWVEAGAFAVKVNGEPFATASTPSSYASLTREWKDGDRVEIALPMRTTVEGLPDGSPWYAILRGPIVLASPCGADNLAGLRAGAGRGDHIAHGPLVPLDRIPALLTTPAELSSHVVPDPAAGPLCFRLRDVAENGPAGGLPLVPFHRLHDSRYQIYWETATRDQVGERRERLAAAERAKLAREAATLDFVTVGEQQPEVDHAYAGEGAETGIHEGRRWRHGRVLQYTLNARGEKAAELVVTYWGGDSGRSFDILANGVPVATETLRAEKPGRFFEKRYPLPANALQGEGVVTVRFVAKVWLAGGIYDLRLMRPQK